MRKVATLFALGAFATSAFATVLPGTNVDLESMTLTPEGRQLVSTMQAQQMAGINVTDGQKKIIKKSYEDNTYIWELNMSVNSTNWYEVLQVNGDDGKPRFLTFEEFPYYWVNYTLLGVRKADKKMVTQLTIPLIWPSMYMWQQTKEELASGEYLPESEWNKDIVTNLDIFEATVADKVAKTFIYNNTTNLWYGDEDKTYFGAFPMAPNMWVASGDTKGWTQQFNGATTYLMDGDATKYSQIDLSSYDAEEDTYTTVNTLFFDNGSTLNLTFSGEARMNGFIPQHITVPMISTPHVVYVGEEAGKEMGYDNLYDTEDWGPFAKFFFLAGTGTCEVGVKEGEVAFDQEWGTVIGVGNQSADDPYGYIAGFLFKEAGTAATDPYGWWEMEEPEITYNDRTGAYVGNDMEPRLNQLIPAGYNTDYMAWSDNDKGDCFTFVDQGYYMYLKKPTRFILGQKDGKGIVFIGYDSFRNDYYGNYAGEVVLHYDPKDLSKTQMISAVSDIDSVEGVVAPTDARIFANGGFISVVAGEDLNAAVYTLGGQLVKAATLEAGEALDVKAEAGVYVVKAGNVVKKVVL